MSESDIIIKPKITPKEEVKTPSMYCVVLHNDSMTPRGFVVTALKACFGKTLREAELIMMEAHEKGHAVVAKFTREIAETKASKANEYSVKHGYVLLFTAEQE